jgi:hypothetical protein
MGFLPMVSIVLEALQRFLHANRPITAVFSSTDTLQLKGRSLVGYAAVSEKPKGRLQRRGPLKRDPFKWAILDTPLLCCCLPVFHGMDCVYRWKTATDEKQERNHPDVAPDPCQQHYAVRCEANPCYSWPPPPPIETNSQSAAQQSCGSIARAAVRARILWPRVVGCKSSQKR